MTVIFADLEASTEMATRLDPEDLRGVLKPFFERDGRGDRAVRRHGREVHRRRGDGRVRRPGGARGRRGAGRPRRPRDAGPRMQALNDRLARASGWPDLDLRVGVNTGEVLAAHTSHREGYVTGDVSTSPRASRRSRRQGPSWSAERTRDARAPRSRTSTWAVSISRVSTSRSRASRRVAATGDPRSRAPDAPMVGRDDEPSSCGSS